MTRILLALGGLAALVVAVLVPTWVFDGGGQAGAAESAEPTRISSYEAIFDVAADGSMDVVETVSVEVTTGDRHGIFRFFDRLDPHATHLRRDPLDVEVLKDGQPVPVEESTQDAGRYVVYRIGDPDVTLAPGIHTYRISYRMQDVLLDDPTGDGSRFYWDLVPAGWAQRMDEVRLRVQLPADSGEVECAVGSGNTTGCPQVTGGGTGDLYVSLGDLPAHTPVTLRTSVDQPVPPVLGETHPWAPRYDPMLGPVPAIVLVALAGLVALGLGALASKRSLEPTPRFPLQYAPPEGIGPAQAAYLLHERVGREQFVASVLHAAERGAVEVEHGERDWTIRETGAGWDGLDPVTAGLRSLVAGRPRGFTADRSSVDAGRRLQEQLKTFEEDTQGWARRERLVVTGPLGGLGGLLVIAAFAAALALGFVNPFGMSLVAIVPGLFAVGASGLLVPGSGTVRTAAGRDLWSRVGGFRRVLSTPASKERFDFSGRQELYTAYLPWAVAFGCADAWAAKYRTETGAEPPVPAYLGAYGGAHTGAYVDRAVADFDTTVSAAISRYEATQSSSSSGGFSGGGGGGGGGGGSW